MVIPADRAAPAIAPASVARSSHSPGCPQCPDGAAVGLEDSRCRDPGGKVVLGFYDCGPCARQPIRDNQLGVPGCRPLWRLVLQECYRSLFEMPWLGDRV